MSTALSQQLSNSPPQLPGTTTLQIDTNGQPGALLHDLGSDQNTLHCRLMLDVTQASGGQLTVAGGLRADGRSVWQLVVDTDITSMRLEADASQISATLPNAMAWHCVEVSLNATAGLATLHINGIQRATMNASLDATRQAWVGGAFFDTTLTGTIYLDDWVLSDQPIGVARAEPQHQDGSDPRRWLVIYNRSNHDSCIWADTYRDRRGVPYANLCGLDLPLTETITAGEYETMRQQVNDYLNDNNLCEQIVGVLLGFKVPGYADVAGQGTLTPIASYLHTDDTHGLPTVNPLYQSSIAERPVASAYGSVRLTGRIDAPSLAEAIAMIDRADHLADQPLVYDQGADVLIDINPDNPNVGPVYTQPVADWTDGEGLSRLRLPSTVYDAQAPTTASSESVVWGWRDAAPPPGYFGTPAGRRAICMQLDPEPEPAVTVRDALAMDWLSRSLQAGYAFAAAPSRAYSLSSLPLPHLFFEALLQGWTVAEAWLVAQPFVRDGLQLIGDPLMPIAFPKAGYDVYGPADRLDLIDFDSPLAMLHAGERELALGPGDLPAAGEPARYLVRQLDGEGRPDLASAATFTSIESDQIIRPALPAWPAREQWPVTQRNGQLLLSAHWPASLRAHSVDAVQLVSQVGSEDPIVLDELAPVTGQRRVVFSIDRPSETTRYRFSIVQGPAAFHTPWSSEVAPTHPPTQTLTVLEASS